MIVDEQKSTIVLLSSLVVAALLTILPLPDTIRHFRPDFMALAVLFWTLNQAKLKIELAWLYGIFADIATANLLGSYAFGFLLLSYLGSKIARQFTLLSLAQQMLLILFILALYTALLILINGVAGHPIPIKSSTATILTTLMAWPLVWGVGSRLNSNH
ncbi:MAG: rod shape-determining protein MreD [bacterium]